MWVRAVRPAAAALAQDPKLRDDWLRCSGTWFAGVNVLENGADGAMPSAGVPPLGGRAVALARELVGKAEIAWDRAQISVCYPGYPRPSAAETDAAFRYRRDRDAAHVDGLVRVMPGRRRTLGEAHGFILGVPLNSTSEQAAPLVVYEGSHEIMRVALRERLQGIASEDWAGEDVTDAYVVARREVFVQCPRVIVHARPGEAYLVHRLALHGVAPWGDGGGSQPRMIAYFRPDLYPGVASDWWLSRP